MALRLKIQTIIFVFLGTILFSDLNAQKVGVVLSGGGAAGFSHIGVLRALEQQHIPIDYIAGTSMGALVAAFYAAGYPPEMIEYLVRSEEFKNATEGNTEDRFVFYFKKKETDAGWITFKLSADTNIQSSLPTNLISPVPIDFLLMEKLSKAASLAGNKFDSLFIPFRCVAADIISKQQVIFKEGNLPQAVRASMSYPFFLKPVTMDNKMLYDGGLYNNFPIDVMENDFHPDLIIGSNVSSNIPPPDEDNLLSQVKNILVNRNTNENIKTRTIIINPSTADLGTFDFSDPESVIREGYNAAILLTDSIKKALKGRSDTTLHARRAHFNEQQKPIVFDSLRVLGVNKFQAWYVEKLLKKKEKKVTIDQLKPEYFRLASDEKLRYINPVAEYKPETGFYNLYLKVKKERDISMNVGGNFSSKPINHAYVSLKYDYLRKTAASITANTYFGKLYSSSQARLRIDFPSRHLFYIEPEITLNRWDYFKSYATFFEEVLPSYLIQGEKYVQMNIGFPAGNRNRVIIGATGANLRNSYYQVKVFSRTDTADVTRFQTFSPFMKFEKNTLNRKQFASAGTMLSLSVRYVQGNEVHEPGSTSVVKDPVFDFHKWFQGKFTYETYYKRKGHVRLGLYSEAVYSSQDFFNNYTATLLFLPRYQPTPESRTLFIEKYCNPAYVAFGSRNVIVLPQGFEIRLEGYVFEPYMELRRTSTQLTEYAPEAFLEPFFQWSSALVYHSIIGPASLSFNYYGGKDAPYSFLFNFGYLIFNKRALD
jgi:NTE family protein